MGTPDPVMAAARNAFVVLIVVLLGLSIYEFAAGEGDLLAATLWTLGVVVFYVSKAYYQRTSAAAIPERESP